MATDSSSGWSSVLADGADTIVAPATAAGRAALAIVRVSGRAALQAGAVVCRGLDRAAARTAQLVTVENGSGEALDRAIAIPYRGPASYTGEDMLEIVVHGAPVVVRATVAALLAQGCRPARPGEFSRRAVANGKLDVIQAEAVADLIAADTVTQARSARRRQDGALRREVEGIREGLRDLLAVLEGSLDFAEHEVAVAPGELAYRVAECRRLIAELLRTAAAGERLREGATVAIVGPANAGKSTLFNALVGAERAIVSATPGTTRDVIEAVIDLGGVPVRLVDTAGLQEEADAIGAEGVRRARSAAAAADVRVLLWPLEGGAAPEGWDRAEAGTVRVRSKADLGSGGGGLAVAAVTGEGLAELRAAVVELLGVGGGEANDPRLVNRRQRHCLSAAQAELAELPLELPEIAAARVRGALDALAELIGEVDDEAVLDAVFDRFCIGK